MCRHKVKTGVAAAAPLQLQELPLTAAMRQLQHMAQQLMKV
jgi:hypothetical protein